MIIAFAFGVIGSLLILANSKHLRNRKVGFVIFLFTAGLAVAGIMLIKNVSKETDSRQLFPLFVPLAAFLLLQVTRILYRKAKKTELIVHMHGLIPISQESRYVTKLEKSISFMLLLFSVIIPYFTLMMIL